MILKSSTVLKYIGQYGFLAGAIAWIGKSLFDTVHGLLTDDWNTDEIIVTGVIGLVHLAVFLYLKNKFVVIELGGQTVKILRDKETIETTWQNVESVERVIFSTPSIYTIRIKDKDGYFIFWDSTISVLGFDNSELGALISQKKQKLDV